MTEPLYFDMATKMIALMLPAVTVASSAIVDESASVSLLQLRGTCMGASLTKHHDDKAAACTTSRRAAGRPSGAAS